jgi:Glycosyl transferase family 2
VVLGGGSLIEQRDVRLGKDLSILIPARNEMWTRRTVVDLVQNIEADTEVIVVFDGKWPVEGDPDGCELPLNERVTVLFNGEAVGQRAATNEAARLAAGEFVMKLDAHCAMGPGFDRILVERMRVPGRENWTIVPKMHNLHVFDWVCSACGNVRYQGPSCLKDDDPDSSWCSMCGGREERVVRWFAKPSPETTLMRFDHELRFQYWGGGKRRQTWTDDGCAETMSLLGACWMLRRDRYWDLNISDEAHGSWGQQGTEVACKTWLSEDDDSAKLMVCRDTWFAHMFRTQGGDFGFPYDLRGRDIEAARSYSRQLWLGDGWGRAKRPFRWIIEHFAPVPDWDTGREIVYYTDNKAPLRIAREVQKHLRDTHIPIVSASLKPMPNFGRKNVVVEGPRGPLTMFRQILAALEECEQEAIFFCEHDVLYHPSHFAFKPPKDDVYYYNVNVVKAWDDDGFTVQVDDCRQTSGLCASRELLVAHYRERVRRVELAIEKGEDPQIRRMGFEPGTHGRDERIDDYKSAVWRSEFPNVDIRLASALTASRRSPDEFRNQRYTKGWKEGHVSDIPGWSDLDTLIGLAGRAQAAA